MAGSGLSHNSALLLQAISLGYVYGYSLMEATGLPSGTVYPALRRLESEGLIRSHWESQEIAGNELRPPRKYYALTRDGDTALDASRKRYPLLARMAPFEEAERS